MNDEIISNSQFFLCDLLILQCYIQYYNKSDIHSSDIYTKYYPGSSKKRHVDILMRIKSNLHNEAMIIL